MLRDMSLIEFANVLASDAPAPGGGSVAALNGAMAAALISMVGGLTAGRKKYAEFEPEVKELIAGADKLREQLIAAVDEDTQAYNGVAAVLSMPKVTDGEKAARSAAMQEALKGASLTPLDTMRLSLDCLKLAKRAIGKTNNSCASDLGVSALCLMTAVRGAWLNVKINLSGIKDAEFNEKTGAEAKEILAAAEALAEEVYLSVESGI